MFIYCITSIIGDYLNTKFEVSKAILSYGLHPDSQSTKIEKTRVYIIWLILIFVEKKHTV